MNKISVALVPENNAIVIRNDSAVTLECNVVSKKQFKRAILEPQSTLTINFLAVADESAQA